MKKMYGLFILTISPLLEITGANENLQKTKVQEACEMIKNYNHPVGPWVTDLTDTDTDTAFCESDFAPEMTHIEQLETKAITAFKNRGTVKENHIEAFNTMIKGITTGNSSLYETGWEKLKKEKKSITYEIQQMLLELINIVESKYLEKHTKAESENNDSEQSKNYEKQMEVRKIKDKINKINLDRV